MHLDGARLWEAISSEVAAEDTDSLVNGLKEYCACFSSVSLCFSKGLGAPIGSIIIGSQPFIDAARHKRKALGGGLRQAALITAPARVAVEDTFLGGKLKGSHERAREVARMWTQRGGKLERETETNMVWLDLEDVGLGEGEDGRGQGGKGRRSKGFVEMGVERGVKVMGGRLVVHYRMFCGAFLLLDSGFPFVTSFTASSLLLASSFSSGSLLAFFHLSDGADTSTPQKSPKKQPHAWRCFSTTFSLTKHPHQPKPKINHHPVA